MTDVIGIGSAVVDYFFEADEEFLKKIEVPVEGDIFDSPQTLKKVFDALPVLEKNTGGSGTNTLAVLSLLKISTSYYGVVGRDADGDFFIQRSHINDFSHCEREGVIAQCACILTHKRKHRSFVSKENSMDNVFLDSFDTDFVDNASFLHITPLYADFKNSLEKLKNAITTLSTVRISFTPTLIYSQLGITSLLPLLQKTTVLFLNEQEIEILTNKDYIKGSKELLDTGVKIVVCTRGDKGAFIATQTEQFDSPAADASTIVDSTCAGDTFAAGFLYGLLKNKSLRFSAQFANTLAAQSLTDFGLQGVIQYLTKAKSVTD